MRIATAGVRTGFAMTWFLQGVRYRISGRTEASAPTEGNKKCGWAGRCGGERPLRMCYKGCGENGGFIGGLPGEGQREGNFWLNLGESREVF